MLAMVLAFVILAQAAPGSAIVTPPQPGNVTVQNNVTVEAPKPDPQAIADAATQSAAAIVVQMVAPTLAGWADLDKIPDFIRTTPPDLTYQHAGVVTMTRVALAAAGSLLALAVVGFAFALMLGQRPGAGRLAFAAALSLTDLVWWDLGIRLNNAITAAIDAPTVWSIVKPHLALPELTADPIKAFGPAVLVIVYAIVVLLLVLAQGARLALIEVMIVVGPLALLCGTLDATRHFYSRYMVLAAGTLFSQVLVVVCLKLAPILAGVGPGVIGALLGIMVLLLARKMPSMLASGQHSNGGGIMRLLLLRRFIPL
jgi:hypothetical protein